MTATPIPRTMHMSIVGIRDMSVIYEPPHNRKPVQTYVLEYDQEVIKEAITKELERDGQVFYIYNRVDTIQKKADEISRLVPEAVVSYAHGQMTGNQIEDIMQDFIEKKSNVLVCTTILESGIDIANANTIIVENADRMGLAALYQIRGRVGRSDRQAYAYITYRKDKMLSEEADKRLKAIKEFTEFGSGFKIAMRDLEIRGAGSMKSTKKKALVEIRKRYEELSYLDVGIRDTRSFVEKYIYKLKLGKSYVSSWNSFCSNMMILAAGTGLIGTWWEYRTGSSVFASVQIGMWGIVACGVMQMVYNIFNTRRKCEMLSAELVSYMNNSLANRLKREQEKQMESSKQKADDRSRSGLKQTAAAIIEPNVIDIDAALAQMGEQKDRRNEKKACLLYTSPSPRDA